MERSQRFNKLALAMASSLFLLSGCALAGQNDQPSNGNDSSSASQAVSDTWITTKVKTVMATTSGLDSTDVSVDTMNGVVTLTGVLPDETQVKKAVAAAKSVDGVQGVDHAGLKVK